MTQPILLRHTRSSTLAGKEQTFDRDRIILGRSGACDVSFDPQADLAVSGRHCEMDGGRYSVYLPLPSLSASAIWITVGWAVEPCSSATGIQARI